MAKDKPRPGWDYPRDPRPKGAQRGVAARNYGRPGGFAKDAASWDANAKKKKGGK